MGANHRRHSCIRTGSYARDGHFRYGSPNTDLGENVFKYRQILLDSEFTRQHGDDEHRTFGSGIGSKAFFDFASILFHQDMEGGDIGKIL